MFKLVSLCRPVVRALGLGLTSAAMTIALGAPTAMATPGGEFAVFAQCPLGTPGLDGCVSIRAESGEVTIGKLKAPIVNPQTLQGGFSENEAGGLNLVGAVGGETFPRTPQPVPAGSVHCDRPSGGRWFDGKHRRFDGHRRWWFEQGEYGLCRAIFENDGAGLYITPELAAPASSIVLDLGAALFGQGTAIPLPVKFRLENPLLGDECYIGSDTTPIVIDFTDGSAGALTGKLGQLSFNPEGTILTISGVTFVNDTFAAPEATGCGHRGRLDSLINTKLGLPAPAGMNTAVLTGTHKQSGANAVAEHDEPTTTTPQPPAPPLHHGQ